MGELWDKFKKNMYYEEPEVKSGTRKKSTKELEQERNSRNSLLKMSQNKLQEDLNKKNINGRVFGKHIEAESAPSRNELKVGKKFAESENDNTSSLKTRPYDKNALLKDVESVKKVRQYGNNEEEQSLIKDVKKKWSDRAYAISDYETAKAIQDEENMNPVSRLGYSLYSGGKSLFKSFVRGDLQTEDGITLDSYNDAINSKMGERSEVYQIPSELGKEVVKSGLNAVVPYLGTTLYTADIAQRTYNDAKKEGYSDNSAILYGLLVGGMDFALNKIGTDVSTKFAKGGVSLDTKQTILENLVDKGLKKVIKNKAMENIATSFVSNGLEEWSQEYIQDFLKYYSLDVLDKGASANPLDFIKTEKESDVNQRAIESFIVGGFVGGIGGGFGELNLTKQQRNTQQALYDYERQTGHELSNANQNTIAMIAKTYQENVGRTPNSKEILDTFKNIRQSQIDTFQKPALEMFTDLDEEHRTEYNNLVNNVSQIIYDTGINVKFDPNQQTVINSENGTIILNPTLTDMPIKNVLLHEISKQTADNDTKNYILNKLKKDGVYETYKNELLATGEFDEANVDSEIVAQELDAIFQNENEIKELAQKDKGLFNSIKDTFNTLTGKLTNNRNTKDALYFREVSNRINSLYGKGDLNDLSKITGEPIEYSETAKKTLENLKNKGYEANTSEAQLFNDFVSKISNDKGIEFDFTNNEELKKNKLNVNNRVVNGYNDNGKIVVNMDSPRALNTIVGHEITHSLENSQYYKDLQKALFNYAKDKGEYDSRYNDIKELYKNVENADIDSELTADLVGDYIFTDSKFINDLSKKDKNLFTRILDELRYIWRQLTGTKQQKELDKAIKMFEKAYKDNSVKLAEQTKYSLTQDSNGRELSKEQQEYFKDSKVRDENGNLKVMYRGDAELINIFDKNHKAKRYTNLGTEYETDIKGFFFTDNSEFAKNYGNVKGYYLNSVKPLELNDNIDDLNQIFKPMLDDMLKNEDIYQWQYDKAIDDGTIYRRFIDDNGIDWETIDTDAFNESINIMRDLGYDSIKVNEGNDETSVMVFDSNQIKNVDNTNPTSSPDIRYSLSTEDNKGRNLSYNQQKYFKDSKARDEEGRLLTLYHGTYNDDMFTVFDPEKGLNVDAIYLTPNISVSSEFGNGSSIRNFDKTLVTRINNAKTVDDLINIFKNDLNTKYKIEKVGEDNYWLDKDDGLSSSPLGTKISDNIYSRKTFNGEVKETNVFEKLKSEALETAQETQMYGSNYELYANITNPLVIDAKGKSYHQIDFEGKIYNTETISSIAKERGYDGVIVKNVLETPYENKLTDDYIVFNANQVKYVKNLNPTDNEDIRYSLSQQNKEYGDYNVYGRDFTKRENGINEQYKSNEKLPETTKPGTYIEPTKPIDTTTKKGKKYLQQISGEGVKSTLLKTKSKNYTAFVDKLNPIQQIADASGNTQLYAKYNNRGMSNGMGQYQIGTAQTDINGREIGKSLNDIWKPIEDANLTTQFDDYLAHRLNEERYDKVPVWDESITPEMSREVIDNYDSQYPQFKAWADEIYKFNDNQLQKMIDAGLSKENARDWLYKNYVTISRDLAPKTNPLVQNAKGVKVNSPIRKAKGGNADIRPMKEAMARQTLLTENAIADNIAGQELLNVLGGTVGDTNTFLTQDLEGNNNALMQNEDGTYNYTVYKNGIPVTMQITKEVADAIRPTKRGEWEELAPFKAIRGVSQLQRTLLTDKNPLFIFTNFFKDIGDAPLNSKYSGGQFYFNYPVAVAKMLKKDSDWKQYVAKGGKENTYFDTKTGEVTLSKNAIKRTAQKFSQLIENANQFIEQAPRFNEYLLTLQNGGTLDEALYNSAEVTTNFARGGEITKALNRNGFNFLNASMQGFDKQYRNFTKQPGAKGYVQLLAKVAIFGIAPAMLNHMLLEDDDDYEELPDYIKDNYYLFKTGDNKFIRIPKGRVMSIFGTSARHTYETAQGNESILQGLKDTGEQIVNNVAPNNPIENNVISPLLSVKNNKSWNGSAIVSTRLQNLPDSEQYDEKTSSIAKWLGKTFNKSPKKIDYVLDQYTGAIGDFVLPMTTPSAESEFNTIPGKLIASPFVSKFSADSTISSKYVSEFYDTKDKLEKEMKLYSSIDESEESFEKSLQAKYLASVNEEVADLYAQKREIQNSDLDDKTKYNQAKAVQRKIDDLTKFALQDYTEGYYTDAYALVGDKEFYTNLSNGKLVWSKVDEKTKKKQEEYSTKYDMSPDDYYSMKGLTQSSIAGSNVYNFEKINSELTKIRDNTTNDKEETIKYINGLDLSLPQKAMYMRTYYKSFNDYNSEIFNYINSLDMIEDQKKAILIYLGFDYNKYTKQFSWK